jgi:hypothetical protein
VNEKIYIHELVDIIGANRARYMHHMAANWSPSAQQDRQQLCFGIWGVVGSTGRWPQVVNVWEEDGFEGLARSFHGELSHPDLQDPKLAKWWAQAAEMRSGGLDRLLLPAPWMPTIEEVVTAKLSGAVYAHEILEVVPGRAPAQLEFTRREIAPQREEFGWKLVAAWRTAMRNDDECIFVWSIPSWETWAALEERFASGPSSIGPVQAGHADIRSVSRFLMVDAPLCPFRTGRQPSRADRIDQWEE